VACTRRAPETELLKAIRRDSIRHTAWDGDNTHPDIFSPRKPLQKNIRARLEFLENCAWLLPSDLPSDRETNPDAVHA
jgi:hypothetical protein